VNGRKPVARVLETRIETPYEGESGLGAKNVPGLPRLAGATFTGAYPFAQIDFEDQKLPVEVSLEAFNPLVPLDTEASGFPVAILRYKVRNRNAVPAKVGIAYSLQNMVGKEGRQAAFREGEGISGLFMSNPMIAESDPLVGTMVLGVLGAPTASVTYLKGWKRAQWWDGPLTFWDDFSADGALTNDSPALSPVGSIAVTQTVAPKGEATVTFILAWHFPNRTPIAAVAPGRGQEKTVGKHIASGSKIPGTRPRDRARPAHARSGRTRKCGRGQSLDVARLGARCGDQQSFHSATNTAFDLRRRVSRFEGRNDSRAAAEVAIRLELRAGDIFSPPCRAAARVGVSAQYEGNGLMGFRIP
jgi:hypothetical protein